MTLHVSPIHAGHIVQRLRTALDHLQTSLPVRQTAVMDLQWIQRTRPLRLDLTAGGGLTRGEGLLWRAAAL